MEKFKKFLKKLTLFDIGILLVVVVLGGSLYAFFKRSVDEVQIRVKVTDQDVLYAKTYPAQWYAQRIQVGDTEKDALGRVLSEIVGVERFNVSSDKQAVYVDIKLNAVFDKRKGVYFSRGKSLVFGMPIRFNFSRVTFDGIVTEFPGSDGGKGLVTGKATLYTKGRSNEPEIVNAVKKGDKMYDSNGVLLAEVTEVLVKPADKVVQNDAGDVLLRQDPYFKDIYMTVEVQTKKLNGDIFVFDDMPLRVGIVAPLNFEKVSLFPLVTDFSLGE